MKLNLSPDQIEFAKNIGATHYTTSDGTLYFLKAGFFWTKNSGAWIKEPGLTEWFLGIPEGSEKIDYK